jgi:hypothetical protein
MNDLRPLSSFPPIAKLFVGLFTTLMLLVTVWAVWMYTIEKGEEDDQSTFATLTTQDEIDAIAADSEAVLAPIWDTGHAGEPEPIDSGVIDTMEESADLVEGYDGIGNDQESSQEAESQLRHNLGLAHVHVNGETLLFFALGAVFLFTSVKPPVKKTVLWVFVIAILAHAVGSTGEGYSRIFDDILAVSGVILLALIAYMCLMIYVDLGRTPSSKPTPADE